MDAFYASVEQRDDPALRGKPVIVAWRGARSVVCAASYEARKFGVHSAMPAMRAERLCPQAVFVAPDFARYKAASRLVHEILARHTDLIEPLSLDEAYLDVTVTKTGLPNATSTAEVIRDAIREEVGLTASAGVAPNKLLAKIASDWRKPDGLFVIRPQQAWAFLTSLPVNRLPGVGRVTERRLAQLGINTVGDLRLLGVETLQLQFGQWGRRLYEFSCGLDDRPVQPSRSTEQISSEITLNRDLLLDELKPHIYRLAERTWDLYQKELRRDGKRIARTVVLKLKTASFRTLTRSLTSNVPPASCEELAQIGCELRARVGLPQDVRYRLVGVVLSGFAYCDGVDEQIDLF